MCYENEFCIDQWHHVDDHKEEFGTTSFKEFDGTEREDETRFKAIKKKLMAFTTNYPTAEAARVIDAIARKAVTAHKEVPDLEGGIIGGLQDQDWDTADRDYARSYKFIYEKISDRLYEAAANVLRHTKLSMPTAKEVAADAIRREVAECKTDYDFHEYEELTEYNLDAVLIDYELGLI